MRNPILDRRLAPEEALDLLRRAADVTVGRSREIISRTDSSDGPLVQLLERLIGEAQADLEETSRYAGRFRMSRSYPSEGRIVEELKRLYLPSTQVEFGEAPLGRETAVHLMDVLLEEVSKFWGLLASSVPDQEPRDFMEKLSQRVRLRLERLRGTVLEGVGGGI